MRSTVMLVAAAILSTLSGAKAMPLSPTVADPSPTIQIRGGCGYGEHRGPFGGCRLNRGPRGAIRAYETGAPRGCPPGRTRIRGICRFVY